jgi:hypothetical protein
MENLIPARTDKGNPCYVNADTVEAIIIIQDDYYLNAGSGKQYKVTGGFETLKMVIKDSAWTE